MERHTVGLVAPPGVIQVRPGDQISVGVEFDYLGPAAPGAIVRVAMFSWTLGDPHNEKAFKTVTCNIPDSPEPGNHVKVPPMVIQLPSSGLPPGLLYGLLAKISGIAGKDWTCFIGANDEPYYQWIIEVVGVEPAISNLRISSYGKV